MLQTAKSIFLGLMVIIFLSGCQTLGGIAVKGPGYQPSSKQKQHNPPPHAPAHGYRHKHQDGNELRYDSGIGAYIVVNIPETYFGNGLYLRMSSDGTWMVAATLGGGWRVALTSEVPPKLYSSKVKNKKNKRKSKKNRNKHKKFDD